MRALLISLVVLIVAVVGGTAVLLLTKPRTSVEPERTDPTGRTAKPRATKPTAADPKPAAGTGDDPPADAEPLPEPPKATAKSELKPLNKEKTLYLETPETGPKRVLFAAEVVRPVDLLEVLVCKKNTKEHEAILRTDLDARFIHAALLAAGAKNGAPVRFVNPQTEQPEYRPASGTVIKVGVHYTRAGKAVSHPAQEWILDRTTKKPMAHDWVFAGSRFMKNPDRPADPEYYCANNGEVIAISNFTDSMLDLPVKVSDLEQELQFAAVTKKIPPAGSKVWVILEPVPDAKK